MVVVRLFGPLELVSGDAVVCARELVGVKPRQLLSILCAHRGRAASKDRLADLLWGDALPANVTATLETYVSNVRRALKAGGCPPTVIVTEPGGYRIAADDWDLDRFDELRLAARGAPRAEARRDLEAAIKLARGEVLADDPHATWAIRLREQYRDRALGVWLDAATTAVDDGDHAAGLARATELLERDRTHEAAYRVAMRALCGLGRRDEAARMFERCRVSLQEELGVQPSAEIVAYYTTLSRSDATVRPPPRQQVTVDKLPLIGREAELAALTTVARDVLATRCGVVFVEGEPGIGKSRLIEELVTTLGTTCIRARCTALERGLAFAPLARALRELPAETLRRFPALGEILPELGASGLPAEIARMQALEATVAVLGAHAPLILALDDVQWIDPSTLAALEYLVHRGDLRLLIVAGMRGNEVGPDDPIRRVSCELRVELGALSRGQLANHCPDAWFERTGGNPLFVVELLRARADGGLPAKLRDLLLARARDAGGDGHRLLAVASVLGRTFAPDIVAALVGDPIDRVLELLDLLCGQYLVQPIGDRFDFRHDLVREALYDSMSPARRRHLHRRALGVLEAANAPTAELAHHAELADAKGVALSYAIAAGSAAATRWANVEAANHFERAARIAAEHPEAVVDRELVLRTSLRLGRLLVTTGRVAEGEAVLHAARADADALADDRLRFDVLDALVFARQRGASAPASALVYAREALAVAERIGDPLVLARAHTLVGSPLGSLGQLEEGLAHCHEALACAERARAIIPAFPMGRLALYHHHQGRERESLEWGARAEQLALEQHDEETLLMVRWVRAISCTALGRYAEAQRALDAIRDVGRGEEKFWHARVPNTWGGLYSELCLNQRALDRNVASLEAARTGTSGLFREAEMWALLNVAADRIALGDLAAARKCVESVRAQVSEVEYARFRWLPRMHYTDACIALADGNAERARSSADACLLLADKHGLPVYQLRAAIAQAAALGLDGKLAQARRIARAAGERADQLELVGIAWRAWWQAADLDGNDDDRKHARLAVRKCLEHLEDPLRSEFLAAVPVTP